MPKFSYTAIDQGGRQKTGTVDANDENDANAKLSGMGLLVSNLSESAGGGKKKPTQKKKSAQQSRSGMTSPSAKKVSGKAVDFEGLTIFTRQLSTLLQAGLPLLRSLEVMIRQQSSPKFKTVLENLAENVRSGNNLSDGLQQYPKVFNRLYVNMVRAGEAGGVLDTVLSRLARFMEKDLKTKKKVQSAMIYPIVVVTVAVAIVAGLMIFIVPRFQQIFESQIEGEMPWLTAQVIGISDFLQNNIIISVLVVVALFFGIPALLRSGPGKAAWDRVALKIPKFGDLAMKASIARFSRTFGTLLISGVPILEALRITRNVLGNSVIQQSLDRVHDRVRDGESLAAPLEQQRIFPTMVTSMIDVGEETGDLAEMLNRIADNYDEDVDNAVASITSIIEPIMIVGLAVIVGTIVIALFLPILEIMKNIQS